MLTDQDQLDRGVLDLIASDLHLLELSIYDLVIAFGGKLPPVDEGFVEKIRSGKLFECFNRRSRNERTYRYYKLFKGLELQVDSFIRVLKLHMDRGFWFMSKVSEVSVSYKLMCLCYVDVVFDLYYGVLKQVITFSLHDCVYLYKFFLKLDNSLVSYRIKHLYIRDEMYDLMLHSLWFALKDAWWLYLKPNLLKPLFPFISHMRVEKSYDVTVNDLNHVLHNIHFVTLISQDISFQSETATIVDSASVRDPSESMVKPLGNPDINYEQMSESDLEIKHMTYVNPVNEVGSDSNRLDTEVHDPNSHDMDKSNNILTKSDFNTMELGRRLSEYAEFEEFNPDVNWSQVIYVAFVGCIYVFLFESYLSVVAGSLGAVMRPSHFVEFLVKRLQDLIQVTNLILEVDCSFTAWAHDKLGSFSDVYLLRSFNSYSDQMFTEDDNRDNHLFNYHGDVMKGESRSKMLFLGQETNMYLLGPTLARAQNLQYDLIIRVSRLCTEPIVDLIDSIYFMDESRLHFEVLYNTEEYLIGPKGPLSTACKFLPIRFKNAIYVETFFTIVSKYVQKVYESDCDLCESIIFDSMSLWDSILDYFDFSSNPQLMEEESVVLLGNILDDIKFSPRVDLTKLEAFRAGFRLTFFTSPKMSESILSLYIYSCLYYISPDYFKSYTTNIFETQTNDSNYNKEFGDNNLDKYMVWLDGVRKKRMLIFGNLIMLFRDSSLLQPVGFIPFDSVYSILAPHTLAQVHPNVHILENNSENDSFSCGTSQSSQSGEGGKTSDSNQYTMENTPYPATDTNMDTGPDSVSDRQNHPSNIQSGSLKMVDNPDSLGSPYTVDHSDRLSAMELPRNSSSECLDVLRNYYDINQQEDGFSRRGNITSKTRYSTKSSRRSSLLDNLMVWGWQIRLELFDSCVLDDFNYFDLVVDMEFASPEYRKYWEHHIRDKTNAKSQFISWPYHSFFFDSI